MTDWGQSDTETDQLQFGLDFEAAAAAAVAELNRKIATCHERRGCPKCHANIGEVCTSLARRSSAKPYVVKNPHRERWTEEVPFR